ncbi:MAG: hypothetical protein ACREET_05925 [Stellaceae bacterium]
MADQKQSHAPQREMDQTARSGMAGKVGQSHGNLGNRPKEGAVKPGGTVGHDVPDHSKEHNTEIAVEAGRHGGEHHDEKR